MKNGFKPLIIGVIVVALLWFIWEWGFCRFYVPPNHMAIVITKTGKTLSPGQILAGKGQKGIQADVLGEGRHFRNWFTHDWEIKPVITIPPGQVAIVTSKVGKDLPQGQFLANDDQKGILKRVLGPGKYRLNPYGYTVTTTAAVLVPVGYAGVVTSLSGEKAPEGEFAGPNQKGVMKDILQPGIYYINTAQYKVDVVEVGLSLASFSGTSGGQVLTKSRLETGNPDIARLEETALKEQKEKQWAYNVSNIRQIANVASDETQNLRKSSRQVARQQAAQVLDQKSMEQAKKDFMKGEGAALVIAQFIEFPSRDGFQITIDMTVEVELLPADVSWLYCRYGDKLAIDENIIMPQINSIARNKGSEYHAKEFIMGEGREKFQNELTKAIAATLAQKKIIVHNAIVRHVEVPDQILDPIQQTAIAVEQNLTNLERQKTAKKLAELNTETTLIDQKRQEVAQQTEKIKAEINADQEKQVGTIRAEAIKKVADIARETARIDAETTRKLAEANASSLKMVEGEKANGFLLKTKAYGDPMAYNMAQFAEKLNPDLKINIMHTGEGTLWTDLEKAGIEKLGGAVQIKQRQTEKK